MAATAQQRVGRPASIPNHTMRDPSALTPAEETALHAVASGLTFKQAAEQLGVGWRTVERRFGTIRSKLCVETTSEAVAVWRARVVA